MKKFGFKILQQDQKTKARAGKIITPHGVIETPAFVPVGTQATVKTLTPEELNTLGVQLFFVNTYHIYLRPGVPVISKFGGLHEFMGWNEPLITDSGGFQVYSLGQRRYGAEVGAQIGAGPAGRVSRASLQFDRETNTASPSARSSLRSEGSARDALAPVTRAVNNDEGAPRLVKITEDGVEFRSHWDGRLHQFTPEKSIEIQHALGADIILAFDDCTPYPVTHEQARLSLSRTHRWARRSLSASEKFKIQSAKTEKPHQALYGVVHGSVFEDLRKESARVISSLDFDGIAIGGVSVGESKEEMNQVLDWVVPLLPEDKPRHLLGVGEIDDIFTLVEHGIDTFDCVQPTRLGRMGHLYTISNIKNQISKMQSKYQIDITKKDFAEDANPVDLTCSCYTCQHFSRAYLHHLFRVRELLAYRLATIHNLYFVQDLVAQIRTAIASENLLELKKAWLYNKT